jgi:hypothetical protein
MEGHGHLDQSLQKLLLGLGGGAPDIFERLVRVEKGGAVEQFEPCPALIEIHPTLWHNPAPPGPQQILNFIAQAGTPIRFSISKRESKL